MFLHQSVSHSVHSGGRGVCPPPCRQTLVGGWADHIPAKPPPLMQTHPQERQQAGGTHPTGMHTCCLFYFFFPAKCNVIDIVVVQWQMNCLLPFYQMLKLGKELFVVQRTKDKF